MQLTEQITRSIPELFSKFWVFRNLWWFNDPSFSSKIISAWSFLHIKNMFWVCKKEKQIRDEEEKLSTIHIHISITKLLINGNFSLQVWIKRHRWSIQLHHLRIAGGQEFWSQETPWKLCKKGAHAWYSFSQILDQQLCMHSTSKTHKSKHRIFKEWEE